MRVLMFGWEFPPSYRRRSGYGLLRHDARAGAKRCQRDLRHAPCHRRRRPELCARGATPATWGRSSAPPPAIRRSCGRRCRSSASTRTWSPTSRPKSTSPITTSTSARDVRRGETTDLWKQRYTFSGKYGANLMEEVARYAMIGRAGGPRSGRAVRRDPRPRLAHLLRRNRRQTGLRKTAGRAHARHGVRPQRREHQFADLCHRTRGHGGRRPCDRRVEPHAQHHRYPLRHSGRKGSDGAQRRAVRRGGVRPPNCGVGDKIVTFLGRITYQKGPDYFVEAAAKVLKRVPNVRFVMAGSGDMMNHVIRRVARLGIADRFTTRDSCAARTCTACSSCRTST